MSRRARRRGGSFCVWRPGGLARRRGLKGWSMVGGEGEWRVGLCQDAEGIRVFNPQILLCVAGRFSTARIRIPQQQR